MTVQFWMQQQENPAETRSSNAVDFANAAQSRYKKRFALQQTLAAPAELIGVGLHSGADVTLRIFPSGSDTGIVFVRDDLDGVRIAARLDKVIDTQLCTKIGLDAARSVGTIEHLMAALRALEVDNVQIHLDGPEVPIMDGSAQPFIEAIEQAGLVQLERPRQVIRILKTVEVEDKGRTARMIPADQFEVAFDIDFDNAAIGQQSYSFRLDRNQFVNDVAFCRTFGFFEQIEMLQKMGLARGGSLENAVVIRDGAVANPGGLRCSDEFVRHKALDAVGDLYLAGLQLQGRYEGDCAGHEMNNLLLKALFADPTAWALSHQSVTQDKPNHHTQRHVA